MKILIGIFLMAVGIPITWSAFNKAVAGEDSYNWVWVITMFVVVFGILTIFAQLKKWMKD